jgi:hypothetical protein
MATTTITRGEAMALGAAGFALTAAVLTLLVVLFNVAFREGYETGYRCASYHEQCR